MGSIPPWSGQGSVRVAQYGELHNHWWLTVLPASITAQVCVWNVRPPASKNGRGGGAGGGRRRSIFPRAVIVPSAIFILSFFWVFTHFVCVEVCCFALVALTARFAESCAAFVAVLHLWDFFFRKPPKRAFFLG